MNTTPDGRVPSLISIALYAEPTDVAAALARFTEDDFLVFRHPQRQWFVQVLRTDDEFIARTTGDLSLETGTLSGAPRLNPFMEEELAATGWSPPIWDNAGCWQREWWAEPMTSRTLRDCARRLVAAVSLLLGDDPAVLTYEYANIQEGPRGPLPCLAAFTYAPAG